MNSGSEYYRKGYYHAIVDTNLGLEFRDATSWAGRYLVVSFAGGGVMELTEGTFAYHDYMEGFRAARNHQWWAAHSRLNRK